MNREIKNHERVVSKERVRKIEIYRKTTSGDDTPMKEDTPPKHTINNNRLPLFKLFLVVGITLSIILIVLLVNPFNIPIKNLDKIKEEIIKPKLITAENAPVIKEKIEKEETLFFDINGDPKLVNMIIAGVGSFMILKAIMDAV